METQRRERPSLQPIWTDYYNLRGQPKTAFRAAHSPLYSASPRSPRALPSPVYPPTPGYDSTMRRHERVMVDRLDQSSPDGIPRILPPIAERSSSARAHSASLISPGRPRSLAAPQSPRRLSQAARRQTIADETRFLLLSRASPSQIRDVGFPQDRRRSLPATPTLYRRRNSHLMREHLKAWGHVYFDHAASADCFVVAAALRSPSVSSGGCEGDMQEKGAPSPNPSRRTFRALVRPRAMERNPFVLQRTFDLDELRATVPDPSPAAMAGRRPSADLSPVAQTRTGRRRSSGAVSSGIGSPAGPEATRNLIVGANALPIREYFSFSKTETGRALFLDACLC